MDDQKGFRRVVEAAAVESFRFATYNIADIVIWLGRVPQRKLDVEVFDI